MIRVLNQDIIVISSEKIAQDLLDRRSAVYSDRPYLATRDPCVIMGTPSQRFVLIRVFGLLGLGGPSTSAGVHMTISGAPRGGCFIKSSERTLRSLFVLFSCARLASLSRTFSNRLWVMPSISKGE
jgi:hypothetical protein